MKLYKLASYIFHPILIPIIGTILFFILLPRHTSRSLEITIITAVFIATYALPLIILSVLKNSKIITSYHLTNSKERRYPLLLYIALVYLISSLIRRHDITLDLALFFYGMAISLIIAVFLLFKKFKASLHVAGITGLLTFLVIFSYKYQINILRLLAILTVLAGIVATSRLHLKAHSKKEVIWGFVIGLIGQLITIIYNI